MSLPRLDLGTAAASDVLAALQRHGAALVSDARLSPAACERALADARDFFALPPAAKAALAIARSPHFRGYSEMRGERDWREQVHFGDERPARADAEPHWRLQGPNLWPDDAAWRERMLAHLHAAEQLGRGVLVRVGAALGVDAEAWLGDAPYLLMKLIGYHPQPAEHAPRPGVAAHLDFSLVTLTLQDDVGGLEVQAPDGTWQAVPYAPGALLVHVGELLPLVTGNRLRATPHRVVNPSTRRSRYSIPVFVNPSLATTLLPALPALAPPPPARPHVHAVLDPAALPTALAFGPAEWRRKGENVWCTACHAAGRAE